MFTGYSALMMAEGLPDDGTIITCDVDPKAEAIARRYFNESPDGHKIEIRIGPALETIKTLSGPIDMVFIDADKGNYSNYYEAVFPLVRPGGLIVADNVLWSGQVLHPETPDDHAIVAFDKSGAVGPPSRECVPDGSRWNDAGVEAALVMRASLATDTMS